MSPEEIVLELIDLAVKLVGIQVVKEKLSQKEIDNINAVADAAEKARFPGEAAQGG